MLYTEVMDKYLLALGLYPKIKSDNWLKICTHDNDYESIWNAKETQLNNFGFSANNALDFIQFRYKTNPDKVLENYQKHEINYVTLNDSKYPKLLKEIYNPPFIIYYTGKLPDSDGINISVVGARKYTDYGRRVTYDISADLSKSGVIIISGLALGLDAIAHNACLDQNGITIAVLASGLDNVCPQTNRHIADKIIKNGGALISEKPVGTQIFKHSFPARNRIISGLSNGVLITEASEHSGTLHTASFAIEQNRNIYAVPGPIYNEMAKGPNNLIKRGAKPVSSAADILEDFGITDNKVLIKPENNSERMIFEVLDSEPKHLDTISKETSMSSSEISQLITMMEIKGKVKHIGGMVYTLK